jgi:hypothetical protein
MRSRTMAEVQRRWSSDWDAGGAIMAAELSVWVSCQGEVREQSRPRSKAIIAKPDASQRSKSKSTE